MIIYFVDSCHVETIVLLRGEKVDGHIDVDLNVGNLKGTAGTALNCSSEKEDAIMDAFRLFHLI